jgi:hypothetical protein
MHPQPGVLHTPRWFYVVSTALGLKISICLYLYQLYITIIFNFVYTNMKELQGEGIKMIPGKEGNRNPRALTSPVGTFHAVALTPGTSSQSLAIASLASRRPGSQSVRFAIVSLLKMRHCLRTTLGSCASRSSRHHFGIVSDGAGTIVRAG